MAYTLLIGTKKASFSFLLHPPHIRTIVPEPNTNTETVLREATKKIHAKYDFFETTLQIEEYDDQMEACKDCTNPE